MRRLVWAFAGHTYHIVGKHMLQLISLVWSYLMTSAGQSQLINEAMNVSRTLITSLVFANAQMPLINAHANISRKAWALIFGLSFHLDLFFVYACSECSGESAHSSSPMRLVPKSRALALYHGWASAELPRNRVNVNLFLRHIRDLSR